MVHCRSLPRTDLAAVACANKVLFAGGTLDSGSSSRVDIYDISTKVWSIAELSKPRASIVAATIGNKVFFAGGCSNIPFFWTDISNRVDIYDIVTNAWSTATLSETRIGFTATTAGSKIYFAGGWNSNPNVQYSVSPTIDVYDDIVGTWSTSTLNYPKAFHASFFKGGKIYWAGGGTYIDEPWVGNNAYTCQVEVRDLTTQTTSLTNLYAPLMYWVNSKGAFEKDGGMVLIYNITGDAPVNFEVYNIATQVWSKGILKNPLGY